MTRNKGFTLHEFYNKIFKRYDIINRIFTFGLDQHWRKTTALECLKNDPSEVLDLCCGTGDLTYILQHYAPAKTQITGYDFNENMLSVARKKNINPGAKKITFIQGNAADTPFTDGHFDCVTIGFGFRNLTFNNPDSNKYLDEIYRVLKSGGKLYILESSVPSKLFFRIFHNIFVYIFLIPLGTIISGNFKAYWYLAHSSSKFYSADKIRSMLLKKGFSEIKYRSFFFGATNLITVTK